MNIFSRFGLLFSAFFKSTRTSTPAVTATSEYVTELGVSAVSFQEVWIRIFVFRKAFLGPIYQEIEYLSSLQQSAERAGLQG